MSEQSLSTNKPDWQQQAKQYWIQGDYSRAAELYERAIQIAPETKSYYWNLGLLLLLTGQEAEAQMTWLLGVAEGNQKQTDQWTAELLEVLQAEAKRQERLEANPMAWAIRQHIREIAPHDPNNLLEIIQLAIKLKMFTGEELQDLEVIQVLQVGSDIEVDSNLLLSTVELVLRHATFAPLLVEFVEVCSFHTCQPKDFLDIVMLASLRIAYTDRQPTLASRLAEICLRLDDKNSEVLKGLAPFYQNARQYEKGIEVAKLAYSLAVDLPDQIYCNFLLLRGLMSAGGYWDEAVEAFKRQEHLHKSLIQENPTSLGHVAVLRLFTPVFFQPYFRDDSKNNRLIQNEIVRICQNNLQIQNAQLVQKYKQRLIFQAKDKPPSKILKIGYLSHCFRRHSVGWLSRWLLKHHNHEQFEIHGYFISYSENTFDPLRDWFVENVDYAHKLDVHNAADIAEQIYQDEIDILVDLDSVTLDTTCEVMALKPAPIQVTWLGWDASGLPAVDYFIADPYVLPNSAQEYYHEKIWRLPQTYVAVDGFEIGIPSLRREQLNIPDDAVIFLSSQKGYKRHPEAVRLQMKVIKEVENSYFLIKGSANQDSIKSFFQKIAVEEGVENDRLRFILDDDSEEIHRANLTIADVVLDTYPYNGATTTLETLWMGIPLVTRVGEQFSARNSYTMLMNVGVTEGIAWTDEEYVGWGIRLGRDEALRQQVSWKLWQSRQTAPLWNAKQFTREMENAYQQMWSNFVRSSS
ncbi:tetratricopeptide repeat protein [Leptolyngbya sp. FACHB-541]|uniref:O-linked N-acetylglucosamine transferase, SPINDLY family protein n=1 Tax=Leptolyngbya sp. FACHB-541 TaxID=2692810 RepID=UPI001684234F|nr:tetratricopeptide repeat protein [Leptolyngbya sp. FACHB-541]MBD1996778.1 tetratricopeptide repeat protein [Leptolyngbya sp. FACHB-541]